MAIAGPVLRRGVALDVGRLDHELARRGLSKRKFAALAGVSLVTLSRARRRAVITEDTLTKFVDVLASVPVLAVDLVRAL